MKYQITLENLIKGFKEVAYFENKEHKFIVECLEKGEVKKYNFNKERLFISLNNGDSYYVWVSPEISFSNEVGGLDIKMKYSIREKNSGAYGTEIYSFTRSVDIQKF